MSSSLTLNSSHCAGFSKSEFAVKLKGRTHRLLPPMSQSVSCLKRQWVEFCICRQNSRHLHEFRNRPQLDRNKVVNRMNERNEMWQRSGVNWIPFIATPKERNKKRRAKSSASKFEYGRNVSCVSSTGSIEKTEAWVSLGVQFVGHTSCLWWDRGL